MEVAKEKMIIAQEILNAGGEIEIQTNPLYSAENMHKYCRTYKINTENGVEQLRYCSNRKNGCHGRGYYLGQGSNGLGYLSTCSCTDKTLEKLEKK